MSRIDPLLGPYVTGDHVKAIAVAEWSRADAIRFKERVEESTTTPYFQRVELFLDACDETVVTLFAAALQKCVIKEVEIEIHGLDTTSKAQFGKSAVKRFAALPSERLELCGPGFADLGIREVCKGLEMSTSLNRLHLQTGPGVLCDEGLRLLSESIKRCGIKGSVEIYSRTQECTWSSLLALLENSQFQSLEIHEAPIDDNTVAVRLRTAISSNKSLRSLVLNAPVGRTTDIPPVAIFLGLTENTILEKLMIGGIGLNATNVLAECLPAIHCLKVLRADWPDVKVLSNRLVDSLRRNASLVEWVDPHSRSIPKVTEMLLSRNRLLSLATENRPSQHSDLLFVLCELSKRDALVTASAMYTCIRQFVTD